MFKKKRPSDLPDVDVNTQHAVRMMLGRHCKLGIQNLCLLLAHQKVLHPGTVEGNAASN